MSITNQQELHLSHSDLLSVLFHLYNADNNRDEESKIRSRFKNLQKTGLPSGSRPTRGSHQNYSFEQVCEMILAFELMEFGISSTEVYENFFVDNKFRSSEVLSTLLLLKTEANITQDLFLTFIPNAVSGKYKCNLYEVYPFSEITKIPVFLNSSRRACCINLGRLLNDILHYYPEKTLLKSGINRPERRSGFN